MTQQLADREEALKSAVTKAEQEAASTAEGLRAVASLEGVLGLGPFPMRTWHEGSL